ncbi:MAG: endonuclease/exonuclease/phosphatase family protein [Novipirellula sp. JB048]
MRIRSLRPRSMFGVIARGLLIGLMLGLLILGSASHPAAAKAQAPAAKSQDGARASSPASLRVLSYNIHHGRGTDDQVDLERIAQVIVDSRADLVALQEVDQRTRRTGGVDQTQQLARLTGMHGQFCKQIDYQGGEYGQAILSRWPLSDLQIHWLPGEPPRERRIVATCAVAMPGHSLLFGSTHWHHANAEIRLRQSQALSELLSPLSAAVIIAGDLNAEPPAAPVQALAAQWGIVQSSQRLKTFPAVKPTKQIDYILYRPTSAMRIVSSEVIDEPLASDHRPLLAVLEFVE